jgi:hypothetical protein
MVGTDGLARHPYSESREMAAPSTTDVGRRDPLPSISHLELDKLKPERLDTRYPSMNGLSVSTAPMGSPNTVHSGPPPPYSYPPSAAASNLSNHAMSGYISPPESTRRSTREEERHSPPRKSLPSIHEALGGDRALPFTGSSQPAPGSTPSSALTQNFPDGPKGPSNPFSAPPIREHPFPSQLQPPSHLQAQPSDLHGTLHGREPPAFGPPTSPRASAQALPTAVFRSDPLASSTFNTRPEPRARTPPPPPPADSSRALYPYSPAPKPAPPAYAGDSFQHSGNSNLQDQRSSFPRAPDPSYEHTIKRHIDVHEAAKDLADVSRSVLPLQTVLTPLDSKYFRPFLRCVANVESTISSWKSLWFLPRFIAWPA